MSATERDLARTYARALAAEHRAVERVDLATSPVARVRSLEAAWRAVAATNRALLALQACRASAVSP